MSGSGCSGLETYILCDIRNGKVEGAGITHPSLEGQERVVRMAYERADLDPNLTAYAELHGTGTPIGDPIEVKTTVNVNYELKP